MQQLIVDASYMFQLSVVADKNYCYLYIIRTTVPVVADSGEKIRSLFKTV